MLEDSAGLTLEGLLEVAGNNPGAMPFDEITREEMTQYLMMFNEEVFIDWERGECYFDSELFRAVLEFSNIPSTKSSQSKVSDSSR